MRIPLALLAISLMGCPLLSGVSDDDKNDTGEADTDTDTDTDTGGPEGPNPTAL